MAKRKVFIIIIFCIVIVAALGFFVGTNIIDKNESKETFGSSISNGLEIKDFKEKLIQNSITIQEETAKAGNLIGAVEGYGYQINDKAIEIYKFDNNSKDELTTQNIKAAKEDGKVKMPSFNNIELDAIYNKGLVLVSYKGHPLESRIVEIFKGL